MKVRAIEMGFYEGNRVKKGEVFEVADGAKARWFTPVQALGPAASQKDDGKVKGPAKGKAKEPDTLSEMTRKGDGNKTMTEVLAKKPDEAGDIA